MFFCRTKLLFSQLSWPCFNMINLQCCVHTVSYGTGYGICPKIIVHTCLSNNWSEHLSLSCIQVCPLPTKNKNGVWKMCWIFWLQHAIQSGHICDRPYSCHKMPDHDLAREAANCHHHEHFFCGSNRHPSFLDSKSLLHHPMPDKQDDEWLCFLFTVTLFFALRPFESKCKKISYGPGRAGGEKTS